MTTTAALVDGFALATSDDDADVRALLRRAVIPGSVSVAFTREPEYFAGEGLAGAHDRTLLHRRDGCLDGVARLSTHTLHHNGRPARVGYLGELRLAPEASHAAQILRDGFGSLHEYVQADALDACFTSIAADNVRARRVLENGRRLGLPTYTPLADLVTLLLPVSKAERASASVASSPGRDELTEFLDGQARCGQLTLTWDAVRWQQLENHGITPADFRVIRKGGASGPIVAAGALWDQRAFKQTIIVGYAGALRWSRPLVNTLAMAGLAPALPAPGQVLPQAAILGLSVASDESVHDTGSAAASYWNALLSLLVVDAARRGVQWLVVSRETRDPQLAMVRTGARGSSRASANIREYRTGLYAVHWPERPFTSDDWDARPFRPEVALL